MKNVKELSITIQDMTGIAGMLRPVTGGVPIAEGAVPENSVFALRDDQGNNVPLQTSVLARWKDGSARWVLLDFQSSPPANGKLSHILSWGQDMRPRERDSVAGFTPVCVNTEDQITMQSGDVSGLEVCPTGDRGLLSISDRLDLALSLTDAAGQLCGAVTESAEVETAGELRSTLSLKGSFRTPAGDRAFQFRLRASVYAGLSLIRLEPLILVDADEGIMQHIRELKLTFKPRNRAQSIQLGSDPGWKGSVGTGKDSHLSHVRLFQYDDQHYSLQGTDGASRVGPRVRGGCDDAGRMPALPEEVGAGRAPGWAELNDGQGDIAVALRDFWQQWPKSLEASPEGLSIGLFPRFRGGNYAHMEPWYKYQYLFDGDCYRLRTGQARRWDVWLDLSGDGESLARAANMPLVPAADPAQAIATGVWDDLAPAGIPEMAEYDEWAENLFKAYCDSIEVQRDYGAMNWGDWFGERQVNWGNHEYDTTNQILIQFARTGDPRYFHVADTAARHSSEVDTIHYVNDDLAEFFGSSRGYPPRAGMVHQHTIGHVSGFYSIDTIRKLFVERGVGKSDNPYLCLEPFNLGHIWTQGTARHYFLTGDPFLKETAEKIGKNIAQLVEDREYRFMSHSHCGRTTGWPLLALAGVYEIDLEGRYLNAMKTLVEDALAEQDPNCGGWLYSLPRGHCYCEKAKHTGMAGFITAILINGLSRYYFLSGDDRLPDAIGRAVTFLDNDTWREERQDWRYTSCPATRPTGQPGVVVMAHVNGVRIANNPEHLRILRAAWNAKFQRLLKLPSPRPGHGKGFSSTMYGCAEAIGLLAAKGKSDERISH